MKLRRIVVEDIDPIPYHTIPYHTIFYNFIEYYTIPYHTIPYHTIIHFTESDLIAHYFILSHSCILYDIILFLVFFHCFSYLKVSCRLLNPKSPAPAPQCRHPRRGLGERCVHPTRHYSWGTRNHVSLTISDPRNGSCYDPFGLS